MGIWNGLLTALGEVLKVLHDATVGLFGEYAWVSAVVLLTLLVRLALLPLAIRQFRSMQKMQQLRPDMKRIQSKYKTDRGMMRTDPEKYRERRQKQQEELMALYKEHDVNPAASCLPLVAQAPIFIALFSVLRSPDVRPELVDATFVGSATLQQNIGQMIANGATVAAGVAVFMLIAMGATTFLQQRQMMGRQATVADDQQMQQQKMMMYIMPVFLVFLGWGLPVGILVYWVTTNVVQVGQQWYMLREVGAGGPPQTESGGTRDADRRGDSRRRTGDKRSTKDSGKRSAPDRARNTGRNRAQGNGHRPGGLGRLGRKRDETRDRRR
ncbi:MAG TPA: membrane protein insertase YidC [Euzebyales bacterium]